MTHPSTIIPEDEGKDSFEDHGTILNQLRWEIKSRETLKGNMIVACFLGAMAPIWMTGWTNLSRCMQT